MGPRVKPKGISYINGYTGVIMLGDAVLDICSDIIQAVALVSNIAEIVARNIGVKDDTNQTQPEVFTENQLEDVFKLWADSRVHNRVWNIPLKSYYITTCGNGVVEPGEQCKCTPHKPCSSCMACRYNSSTCTGACCRNGTLISAQR